MEIDETDLLARHALEKKSHYRPSDNTVKPKAFQPARDGATSTFKVTSLSHDEIKELGKIHVADPQGKTVFGWSEITVQDVIEVGLTLDPNNNPPGHVNIINWPDTPDKQISIQQMLAAKASFVKA